MFRVVLLAALAITGIPAAQTAQFGQNGLIVAPAELARLAGDPSLVVLHVADRTAAFEEAHVPGARFLRYGDFAIDGPEGNGSELPPVEQVKRVFEAVGVSDGSRVVIYGNSPVAAARAFFTLDVMGHRHVGLLDGGLRAWREEGRPVATGPQAAIKAGQFNPVLDPQKLADAQLIQAQMAKNGIALVDVRPDAEYLGSDGGMGGQHAAGHIAGARQLPWNTLVGENGRFLPRDQLQARMAAAGVSGGKPVVAYCMIGMRASVVYFVARHLGHDVKLYDGSIVDWSRRKLPVQTGRQQ